MNVSYKKRTFPLWFRAASIKHLWNTLPWNEGWCCRNSVHIHIRHSMAATISPWSAQSAYAARCVVWTAPQEAAGFLARSAVSSPRSRSPVCSAPPPSTPARTWGRTQTCRQTAFHGPVGMMSQVNGAREVTQLTTQSLTVVPIKSFFALIQSTRLSRVGKNHFTNM